MLIMFVFSCGLSLSWNLLNISIKMHIKLRYYYCCCCYFYVSDIRACNCTVVVASFHIETESLFFTVELYYSFFICVCDSHFNFQLLLSLLWIYFNMFLSFWLLNINAIQGQKYLCNFLNENFKFSIFIISFFLLFLLIILLLLLMMKTLSLSGEAVPCKFLLSRRCFSFKYFARK